MTKSNILKIVSTYISIILGAGFISGKELYFFFGKYKNVGIFTFLIASIIFIIILYKQLKILNRNQITQYHDFSLLVFDKKISFIIENITLLFLFVTISTMVSAFCNTLYISFGINIILLEIMLFFILYLLLINGIKIIVFLNTILMPIMFLGILTIGIYLLHTQTVHTLNQNLYSTHNYLFSLIFALLYVSFNSLTVIPMICNMTSLINNKKTIFLSSVISGIILFLLGFFLLYPLILNKDVIATSNIPILTLLSLRSNLLTNVYIIVLISAITSTLTSTSISFINTIEKKFNCSNNSTFIKIIILIVAISFSNLGFEIFVSYVYPLFGILGLVQIYYVLKY